MDYMRKTLPDFEHLTQEQRQAKAEHLVARAGLTEDAVGTVYDWFLATGDDEVVVRFAVGVAQTGHPGWAYIAWYLQEKQRRETTASIENMLEREMRETRRQERKHMEVKA